VQCAQPDGGARHAGLRPGPLIREPGQETPPAADPCTKADAPALVALGNDGSWFSSPTKQIVNYRVEGNTYVVDRVLSSAALISGVGRSQSEVQISHTGGRS
jgi:hypothetical protein